MKKQDKSQEITSFNDSVPEIASLVEVDDAALELVTGGRVSTECLINNCESNNRGCIINNCGSNLKEVE